MKRLTRNIVFGGSYLNWHLHLLGDDEQRLKLLSALDQEFPLKFWEGTATIPMELTVTRVFADQNLDIPNPLGEELVPVSQPDGSEWKPLLDWLAVGGLYKTIAGPPRNNPRMIRIVSPALKSAMGRFHMPPHRFYPVRVRHEFTGEERDYFMFHLLGDLEMEEMEAFWPAMKFYVYEEQSPFEKKPRKTIRNYPPGAVITTKNMWRFSAHFWANMSLTRSTLAFHTSSIRNPTTWFGEKAGWP